MTQGIPITPFAQKRFKDPDLAAFASISSDRNPLHMDPTTARRAMEGSRVVHGVYVMLYGLDRLAGLKKKKLPFHRIKCEFKKPVLIDEQVDYLFREQKDGSIRMTALVEKVPCVEADLSDEGPAPNQDQNPAPGEMNEKLDDLDRPLEWGKDDFLGFSAVIRNPKRPRMKTVFPRLCKVIGVSNVSALARLSYIVGMICPGLYSIFASLDVRLGKDPRRGYTSFGVTQFDDRFNLLALKLGGDLSGSMKAFRRPRPFHQPSMDSIKGSIVPGEFAKCKSLVIGGSRGLGELTAKLICAGGGDVYLGYYKGKDDAEKIAREIEKSGSGVCHPARVDIFSADSPRFREILGSINCLYYYPTPVIFKKQPGLFHKRHFEEFVDFYIGRFFEICGIIEENSGKKIQIYYPSTSFIDKRPNGMTVYAMAKAAAEILIQDMNRNFKKVNVLCSRLPRLGSDQTNSIIEVQKEDNLAALLPIVRDIQSRLND